MKLRPSIGCKISLAFSAVGLLTAGACLLIPHAVLAGSLVLLLAIIVGGLLARTLSAPVRKLRAAAADLEKGCPDVEIGVESRDEVGDLARSFERLARALEECRAQLMQSEKMAAFGQLGAGITHEVKNSMTGLLGFTQVARQRMDQPEKVRDLLKMIETEANRSKEILEGFLRFARQKTRQLEEVDLNRLVQETSRLLEHQLMLHRIKLSVQLAEGAPVVRAIPGELQQVLLNLALNAQQAMPAGGEVTVSTGLDGDDTALISVVDNGPGVPEEIRSRIFEPFASTKPPGEGTGLGLFVSRGIIRDHQGELSLESREGRNRGAAFTIRLPAVVRKAGLRSREPARDA
ncbi:MAG: HAMP domain-containing protein [Deltaproteobacteria bacterium]|nr:HAMP domain-containing protein [Deltaproteobacteria bacterium]